MGTLSVAAGPRPPTAKGAPCQVRGTPVESLPTAHKGSVTLGQFLMAVKSSGGWRALKAASVSGQCEPMWALPSALRKSYYMLRCWGNVGQVATAAGSFSCSLTSDNAECDYLTTDRRYFPPSPTEMNSQRQVFGNTIDGVKGR
eukprot:6660651-Pyramimonas_sp.AAC.1